jgi:hypothetical protein
MSASKDASTLVEDIVWIYYQIMTAGYNPRRQPEL